MEKQMLNRSVPPPAAPMKKIPFPTLQHQQLDNGVPVISVPFGTQEIMEVSLVFPAGRSFETAPGIATFTGKMMQEGTRQFTGLEFARKLDHYGAYIHVDTGYETAAFCLTTLSRHMAATVPLLAEVVVAPIFPDKELEKLRNRTLQHLDVEEKKTAYNARKEFNRLLFGQEHPYGRTPEKEDVSAIDVAQLKAYHARNYNLRNAFIVVVGRYDEAKLLPILNAAFGAAAFVSEDAFVDLAGSRALKLTEARPSGLHYFEKSDSMQATVRVGHAGFSREHPDYYRLQVVNTILGGYFGSRLMKNIREDKGFTYGIGSAWLSMKYSGIFLIQSDVGNAYIEPTLKEIAHEVNRLIHEGVGEEELSLVKNYMLGRSASARETPSQIANLIRNTRANGVDISQLDEKFDIVSSVTTADVKQLAEAYMRPEQMLQVVCGKMGEEKAEEAASEAVAE
ncbi:MAG: pitrilysin family protein [Bacteroidota bacterium]